MTDKPTSEPRPPIYPAEWLEQERIKIYTRPPLPKESLTEGKSYPERSGPGFVTPLIVCEEPKGE